MRWPPISRYLTLQKGEYVINLGSCPRSNDWQHRSCASCMNFHAIEDQAMGKTAGAGVEHSWARKAGKPVLKAIEGGTSRHDISCAGWFPQIFFEPAQTLPEAEASASELRCRSAMWPWLRLKRAQPHQARAGRTTTRREPGQVSILMYLSLCFRQGPTNQFRFILCLSVFQTAGCSGKCGTHSRAAAAGA